MKITVSSTPQLFFLLFAFLSTGIASAQQQLSSGSLLHAHVKCIDEPYVSVTADPARSLPLQVVAKAACNERVTIVSDERDYSVRIVTADGTAGYVTRYELVIEPAKPPAPSQPAPAAAQNSNAASAQNQQTNAATPSPSAADAKTSSKPRIFITDSQSWSDIGGFGNSSSGAPDNLSAGYNPEMPDIYQAFTSDCPGITVVQQKADANYAILFDRGSTKKGLSGLGGLVKFDKVSVVMRNGQTLIAQQSRSMNAAVSAACTAIAQQHDTSYPSPQTTKASH